MTNETNEAELIVMGINPAYASLTAEEYRAKLERDEERRRANSDAAMDSRGEITEAVLNASNKQTAIGRVASNNQITAE